MTLQKGLSGIIAVPKSRSSFVVAVGGLATFVVAASFLFVSYPIYSSSQGYFQEGDLAEKHTLVVSASNDQLKLPTSRRMPPESQAEGHDRVKDDPSSESEVQLRESASESQDGISNVLISRNGTDPTVVSKDPSSILENNQEKAGLQGHEDEISDSDAKSVAYHVDSSLKSGTELSSFGKKTDNEADALVPQKSIGVTNGSEATSNGSCDLYQGKWIHDPAGPLYTNNTCPFITQMQNCQGNGRPDKEYENYRWKPSECDLPRFNPRKFLELLRGKTLAFVGDSVARNQMESMLCILWQEEVPVNQGNRRMQKWLFRSTRTMIIRIWSSWLLHHTDDPFQFAPKGVTKVFLDVPDENFMDFLTRFDVLVLSSGHWFAKQSAYVLNNTIVGGQLWWPKNAGRMKFNNIDAFGISVETVMTALARNGNFTGLAVVRSYSPDHYEGGAWNTGGSCTGKVRPLDEVVENGFTNIMHEKQVRGFEQAVRNAESDGGGSGRKLRLMDVTKVFGYRADGHPGPYRSPDPNKVTKRGPNGEPPPQDCLHWCMPGPVDTWNEILLEVIRKEFEQGAAA